MHLTSLHYSVFFFLALVSLFGAQYDSSMAIINIYQTQCPFKLHIRGQSCFAPHKRYDWCSAKPIIITLPLAFGSVWPVTALHTPVTGHAILAYTTIYNLLICQFPFNLPLYIERPVHDLLGVQSFLSKVHDLEGVRVDQGGFGHRV